MSFVENFGIGRPTKPHHPGRGPGHLQVLRRAGLEPGADVDARGQAGVDGRRRVRVPVHRRPDLAIDGGRVYRNSSSRRRAGPHHGASNPGNVIHVDWHRQ